MWHTNIDIGTRLDGNCLTVNFVDDVIDLLAGWIKVPSSACMRSILTVVARTSGRRRRRARLR